MKSKILSEIKTKLRSLLSNKEVIDIIVFGSVVKGKAIPRDIDIAIISEEKIDASIEGFHVSTLNPSDFFINPPSIATTLLREGYSLKNNKPFSEVLRFKSRILFIYNLNGLTPSKKVSAVNFLRGKNKTTGLVKQLEGEWLANQVFTAPLKSEHIIEGFLIKSKIKFTKNYLLIH
ncbi:MAG: nucleotidyltransferase domain-containing protein [archaeon]|nr:nucleotidyltransferase domain-containing protein [archaeon]